MIIPVRIHRGNFGSRGWATEQVLEEGDTPMPHSPYVRLRCPPIGNNASPSYGAVGMQLVPLSGNIFMRRVRLNHDRQPHRLHQISVLRYMTLVIPIIDTMGRPNLAPGLVLRIHKGGGQPPANIFFNPSNQLQSVIVNQWQEWDALHGYWQEFEGPDEEKFTLADFIQRHRFARLRNVGQGAIRFTIGGDNLDYALFYHYVDRFMINNVEQPNEIFSYDFDCGPP